MTAQELRAQADSLAAQALHGDLFSSPASEAKIQELRAQARALETETETVSEVETVSELDHPLCDVSVIIRAGGEEMISKPRYAVCDADIVRAWVFACAKYTNAQIWLRGLVNGEARELELRSLKIEDIYYEERALLAPVFDALSPTPELTRDVAAQAIEYHEERLNHFTVKTNPPMRLHHEGALSDWRAILETVSETETETKIPAHDDDDLMTQWREVNRAGDGQSFGDPDDLTCEIDIYDSAEIEGATVLCGAGEGYLVRWLDDYYLVCDANGWWACRVTL